jgi:hypothetical protein
MTSMVEIVAGLLQPDEREAVLGDLTESGATAWNRLLSVLGFVARQQLESWRSWQPWAASSVALPGSLLLLGVSFALSKNSLSLLHRGPIRGSVVLEALLLLAWAWTSGFVVGSLSQRTRWVSAALCAAPCLSCVLRFHETSLSRFCVLLFLAPAVVGAAQGMRHVRLHISMATALALVMTALMLAWSGMSARNWLLLLPAGWLVVTSQRSKGSEQERTA